MRTIAITPLVTEAVDLVRNGKSSKTDEELTIFELSDLKSPKVTHEIHWSPHWSLNCELCKIKFWTHRKPSTLTQ